MKSRKRKEKKKKRKKNTRYRQKKKRKVFWDKQKNISPPSKSVPYNNVKIPSNQTDQAHPPYTISRKLWTKRKGGRELFLVQGADQRDTRITRKEKKNV